MKRIDDLVKNLIFSFSEISECFSNKSRAIYWITNSVKTGVVVRVRKELYALTNPATGLIYVDKFMIGSKISEQSYIAYHTALEFHGLANQVYNSVFVASKKRFRNFDYNGIRFKRVKFTIDEGITTVKSSCDILVTDLERTIIDCIDDIERAGGAEELLLALSYIKKLDSVKLIMYLKTYNKKNLWQKTGYLLERFNYTLKLPSSFFTECQKNKGARTIYYLNDDSYVKLSYISKWNIIAPTEFANEEI